MNVALGNFGKMRKKSKVLVEAKNYRRTFRGGRIESERENRKLQSWGMLVGAAAQEMAPEPASQ